MKISLLLSLLPLLLTSCNYDPYHHYFNEWDDTIDFIINDLGLPEEKFGVLYNLELGDSSVTKEVVVWENTDYTHPDGNISMHKTSWISFGDYLSTYEAVDEFCTSLVTDENTDFRISYFREDPPRVLSRSYWWTVLLEVETDEGTRQYRDDAIIEVYRTTKYPGNEKLNISFERVMMPWPHEI